MGFFVAEPAEPGVHGVMETARVGLRAVRIVGLAALLALGGLACQPIPDELPFDFEQPARQPVQPAEAHLLLELLEVCVVEDGPDGVDPCGELPSDFDFVWDPEGMMGEPPPEHDLSDADLGVEPDADLELLLRLLSGEAD